MRNQDKPLILTLLGVGLLTAMGILPAAAQDAPADTAGAAADQPTATGEMGLFGAKVTLHGYLSQAYAFSDGNQIIGIPKQGTADYRTAALQIRADMSPSDSFVVQLGHEKFALSPTQKSLPEVGVEWLFYEHRFGDSSIKVGRVKVPYGIYNEVRAVGIVLPFYRPPRDFYGNGTFTTDAIDGATVSHSFNLGKGWILAGDLFYGNWNLIDSSQNDITVSKSLGSQLFLDTPIPGLRLGLGAMRFDAGASTPVPTTPATYWREVHGSIQGTFGHLDGEVEYRSVHADLASGMNFYNTHAGYARLGVHLTEKWLLHAQHELVRVDVGALPQLGSIDFDRDDALALAYKPRFDLVIKAEYHWNKGYFIEPTPDLFGPKAKTDYGILSLSTSF